MKSAPQVGYELDIDSKNNRVIYVMKTNKFTAGFTIAELLLSLAITGILLAAVAVAFNASAINYQENEHLFKTINKGRQALSRITTDLRTANSVNPDSPQNECALFTAGGDNITYKYNNTNNTLYLITNDNLADSDYVLCDNVSAMTFKKNNATEDGVVYVKSVQISMTVASGSIQQTVAAATAIRRNLN